MALLPASDERILSVAEITRQIKDLLGSTFPAVWVKGEVSGFKGPHANGHFYFNLKDAGGAVLNCVMFQSSNAKLTFPLKDGMEVEAFGRIDVYGPRGSYQLNISQMRPAGIGALLARFEELKHRLTTEGLFESARKKPLPRFPRTVGVVTSPVGAAVKDIVRVLRARWPGIQIVFAPVKVQGDAAAPEIAAAIERFDRWGGADVLIVGRGGGSIEDLWAFNEEVVVRAIAAAHTPIVSAVGHEVDFTLADAAADVRAATPSNAAELVVRDVRDTRRHVQHCAERTSSHIRAKLARLRHELQAILKQHGFKRLRDVFAEWRQRTDDLRDRLDGGVHGALDAARARLQRCREAWGLRGLVPQRVAEARTAVGRSRKALDDAIVSHVLDRRRHAMALGDRLRALSPRLVLERGYALVRGADGAFVRSAEALATGAEVTLEFARGQADATVTRIRDGDTGRKWNGEVTNRERGDE